MKKLILVLLLPVTGCGNITMHDINQAIELCKHNGGIYNIDPNRRFEVECNNGALFEYKSRPTS